MLLALIALFTMASVVLFFFNRNKRYLFMFLSCLALADYLFWVIVYIAKKGGITSEVSTLLYLHPAVRVRLQYLLITLRQMSLGASLGRHLFPALLFNLALEISSFLSAREKRICRAASFALPAALIVCYLPQVFERLIASDLMRSVLVRGSYAYAIGATALSCLILAVEYVRIRQRFFKRRFLEKYAVLFALALLYTLYCRQDPGQMYLFYRDSNMFALGLAYLGPSMSAPMQLATLLLTLVSGCFSFWFLSQLAASNIAESRQRHEMNRKSEIARVGGNIFVHSIKNQLLAAMVYDKRINQELRCAQPDIENLIRQAEALHRVNESMMGHINALYRNINAKTVRLEPVRIDGFLEGLQAQFAAKCPGAKLELSVLCGPCTVRMDRESLTEAALNLLQNAWEANQEAGRAGAPVQLECSYHQQNLLLRVTDRGAGMSKSTVRRLFEPFFTEKNANTNWGMGLYYVRKVARSHRGSVYVESEPGKGSSFYLLLPSEIVCPMNRVRRTPWSAFYR